MIHHVILKVFFNRRVRREGAENRRGNLFNDRSLRPLRNSFAFPVCRQAGLQLLDLGSIYFLNLNPKFLSESSNCF
jgi:hypothetical protein